MNVQPSPGATPLARLRTRRSAATRRFNGRFADDSMNASGSWAGWFRRWSALPVVWSFGSSGYFRATRHPESKGRNNLLRFDPLLKPVSVYCRSRGIRLRAPVSRWCFYITNRSGPNSVSVIVSVITVTALSLRGERSLLTQTECKS